MYGHRSGIKNNLLAFQEVYHHIRQFDHFKLSMNVRILEKINHNSNNPNLSTLHRRHKSIRAMAPSYRLKSIRAMAPSYRLKSIRAM